MSLLAHAEQFEWENFWLTMNRAVIVWASAWAFFVVWRIARISTPPHPGRQRVIPSAVLWFTMFWSGSLAVYVMELILFDRVGVSGGAERVFYAFALAWTIFGLTWTLSIGGRAAHLGRIVEVVHEVKKAGKDGEDES